MIDTSSEGRWFHFYQAPPLSARTSNALPSYSAQYQQKKLMQSASPRHVQFASNSPSHHQQPLAASFVSASPRHSEQNPSRSEVPFPSQYVPPRAPPPSSHPPQPTHNAPTPAHGFSSAPASAPIPTPRSHIPPSPSPVNDLPRPSTAPAPEYVALRKQVPGFSDVRASDSFQKSLRGPPTSFLDSTCAGVRSNYQERAVRGKKLVKNCGVLLRHSNWSMGERPATAAGAGNGGVGVGVDGGALVPNDVNVMGYRDGSKSYPRIRPQSAPRSRNPILQEEECFVPPPPKKVVGAFKEPSPSYIYLNSRKCTLPAEFNAQMSPPRHLKSSMSGSSLTFAGGEHPLRAELKSSAGVAESLGASVTSSPVRSSSAPKSRPFSGIKTFGAKGCEMDSILTYRYSPGHQGQLPSRDDRVQQQSSYLREYEQCIRSQRQISQMKDAFKTRSMANDSLFKGEGYPKPRDEN